MFFVDDIMTSFLPVLYVLTNHIELIAKVVKMCENLSIGFLSRSVLLQFVAVKLNIPRFFIYYILQYIAVKMSVPS
jgi:hypothetical protein